MHRRQVTHKTTVCISFEALTTYSFSSYFLRQNLAATVDKHAKQVNPTLVFPVGKENGGLML